MSKLILCSGTRTNIPYGFSVTGSRVYSIEELCYYLYHHIDLIEEDIFCEALFDWIDKKLMLPDRAEKLRNLKQQKADVKALITVIMCSADYYTETEIKGMLKILDEYNGMSRFKRSRIKADGFLTQRMYREAAAEYGRLLEGKYEEELAPEEYGDILHNLAVAKLHISGLKEASKYFLQAYERNSREESLKQYLYALKLNGEEEQYLNKLSKYQVSDELKQNIEDFIAAKRRIIDASKPMEEFLNLKQKKEKGQMLEYYVKAGEILEAWKAEIRRF